MKKIITIIFLSTLFSCKTMKTEQFEIKKLDENIINNIRDYREAYNANDILIVVIKNKKRYIKRISNMSFLYNYKLTNYSIIDGVPALIYDKKKPSIDPVKFNDKTIKSFSTYLNDDMLMEEIRIIGEKNISYICANDPLLIDRSSVYIYSNERYDVKSSDYLLKNNLLKENFKVDIINHYRVIEGGIDERKEKVKL